MTGKMANLRYKSQTQAPMSCALVIVLKIIAVQFLSLVTSEVLVRLEFQQVVRNH